MRCSICDSSLENFNIDHRDGWISACPTCMEVIQENLDSLAARAKKKDKLEELDNEFDCFEAEEIDIELEFPEFVEPLFNQEFFVD